MRAKQDIISRSKKGCLSRGHSKMGNATSLSDDVLARAASFLYHKEQFLALRATSKRGLAVIRRAVEMKLAHFCRKLVFHGKFEGYDAMRQLKPQEFSETPLYVYLMGRLFGAGCMRLDAAGKSDQSISLIRSFVRQTRGGLRELNLWTARVSSDVLVELCAASPNLVRLTGPNCVHTSDEAIQAIPPRVPCSKVSNSRKGAGRIITPPPRLMRNISRPCKRSTWAPINISTGRRASPPFGKLRS